MLRFLKTSQLTIPIGLFLIVLLAGVLRFWNLGTIPKGALVDEMHYGYLAWSILETGMDEHRNPYPLIFKGFGDNKLPGQVYSLVPLISWFGMNTFTIRIPSALAGTLLPIAIFGILSTLKYKKKQSLIGAFITAITPWSFLLSRFGFESNSALLFWSLGIWSGLAWIKTKKRAPLFGATTGFLWAITWYFYIPYRPITIVFVFLLVALKYGSSLLKLPKKNILIDIGSLVVTFGILVTPFLLPSAIGVNNTRLNQVGILQDPIVAVTINEQRTFCSEAFPTIVCYSLFNKGTFAFLTLTQGLLHTYAPQYMATTGQGEIEYLTIDKHGQLLSLMYPFLLIGMGMLSFIISKPVLNKTAIINHKLTTHSIDLNQAIFIVSGLIITPIPALLVGSPQPVRQSALLPFVLIATCIGLFWVYSMLKIWVQKMFIVIISLAITGLAILFFVQFYAIHPLKNEIAYDSHLPDFFAYIQKIDADTQIAYRPTISDPIMYYAFYTQVDPQYYQEHVVLGELEPSGFQHATALGNFFTTDMSPIELGCKAIEADQQLIYITNEALSFPVLYKAQSHHRVHTLLYVYDVTGDLTTDMCHE